MNAPDFDAARTHFLQGLQHHEARSFAEAEASYRASLQHLPGRPSTLCNLGATLIALGRPDEALPLLDASLAAEPGRHDTLAHRGAALTALERHAEALACFAQLLQAGVDDAPTHFHHALNLVALERPVEAEASYRRAIAHDPQLGEAHSQLGGLLKDMGRSAEAVPLLERAIALGAGVDVNRYLLASLTGRDMPEAPPPAYVEQLFDAYAPQFGAHLQRLQYRVPEQLVAALGSRHFTTALDLGCGTGLCGPLLRPWVDQLDGIDLSRRMLEQAAALRVYDTLVHGEIVQHLTETPQRYELVLAADVFIYVGELSPVFAGVRRVLQPGGVFTFSVELADESSGVVLRPSSRYAHAEPYLRALARAQGLVWRAAQAVDLRLDQARPVRGLLVQLQASP